MDYSGRRLGKARVAELVDALDLGSSGVTCRGSSPLSRTSIKTVLEKGFAKGVNFK